MKKVSLFLIILIAVILAPLGVMYSMKTGFDPMEIVRVQFLTFPALVFIYLTWSWSFKKGEFGVSLLGFINGVLFVISAFAEIWFDFTWLHIVKAITFVILMICSLPICYKWIQRKMAKY